MRLAFLALLTILILGGGGTAAYFYFQHPAEASVGNTPEHTAAKEDPGARSAEGHKFVELDPLVLPIVDEDGVSQVVSIVVVLEVDSDRKEESVKTLQPRLKDAYIQDLYGVLNKHAALKDGVIQIKMIKERLAEISDRVMGDGVVDDVLLQVVSQRPI